MKTVINVAPIWKQRQFQVKSRQCFILMPFREDWSERIWRIVHDILKGYGLEGIRADNMYGQDVMEDIWTGINSSEVVIADASKRNPNVFYELGIVHTIGKKAILLAQSAKDIPFDLKRLRHIIYKDNADGYEVLRKEIPASLSAFGIKPITVPLPADLSISAPKKSLSQGFSKWLGKWEGNWDGKLSHILAVEEIKPPTVTVVYAWGDSPEWNIQRGWRRVKGRAFEDRLLLNLPNGAKVRYLTIGGSTLLDATYERGGGIAKTKMRKLRE